MATNIAAFRAKVIQERAIVAEEVALVDMPDEQARYNTALAVFQTAETQFGKAAQRWTLANEKINRLEVLDAQIALLTP